MNISFYDIVHRCLIPYFQDWIWLEAGLRILFLVDVTHSDLRLVTFDTHLNMRKGKYLTMRNQLLSGKAGPVNFAYYLFK